MVEYTELELRVIGELKESIDPIIMNEQEMSIEYNRIANSIGIEADDVQEIYEKWQFDKIREDIAEMDRRFKKKKDIRVEQEDDGYPD
tara:strand:+ start:109 stop:372 length:264 start_codon:yes stop_codon:yes gene_type:complete